MWSEALDAEVRESWIFKKKRKKGAACSVREPSQNRKRAVCDSYARSIFPKGAATKAARQHCSTGAQQHCAKLKNPTQTRRRKAKPN
jgi:hypothetical protein